eukprot:12879166-Alexandrium_andersonii.AAC.1
MACCQSTAHWSSDRPSKGGWALTIGCRQPVQGSPSQTWPKTPSEKRWFGTFWVGLDAAKDESGAQGNGDLPDRSFVGRILVSGV